MKNKNSNITALNTKLLNAQIIEANKVIDNKGVVEFIFELRQKKNQSEIKNSSLQVRVLCEVARRRRNVDPTSALVLLEEALVLAPENAGALLMAATIQEGLGRRKEAIQLARKVLIISNIQPKQRILACQICAKGGPDRDLITTAQCAWHDAGRPLSLADGLLDMGLRAASWQLVDEVLEEIKKMKVESGTPSIRFSPRTHLLWCGNESANMAVVRSYAQSLGYGKHTTAPTALPIKNRRLRIGYLSSDYRDHPTSRLLMGLLRNHDRQNFEIFLYCSGWDDGSALRRELISRAEHFNSVTGLSDVQAAQRIREDGIDVLVELNGPTRGHRMGILAERPAAVQIDYLGWPGSVGGGAIDYIVGDDYTIPHGNEKSYPEKVIRLYRVYQINDYAGRRRGKAPPRAKLGLPEDVKVLGVFNQINKVRRDVWHVWMEILRKTPSTVLWILDPGLLAVENIRKLTIELGVDPDRVIVAPACPQKQHLERIQHCNLMLDPWPYGGHTTTSDALFAGVPVLALQGQNFAGRVSGALLESAGLGCLVQSDKNAYIDMAIRILNDDEFRTRLKYFLDTKVPHADIFKAKDKARQFETAYKHAHNLALEGKPFEHINLKPRKALPHAIFDSSPVVLDSSCLRSEASVSSSLESSPELNTTEIRPSLVLVCGPWSSGTSAVTGVLASSGLQAPGPFFAVNDQKTPNTGEMVAFRNVLRNLASENTLEPRVSNIEALKMLKVFRDKYLLPKIQNSLNSPPVLLKHGLAAFFIGQLNQLFNLKLVIVVRPLDDIESTRQRRRWHSSFGRVGAQAIYRTLFAEMVNGDISFHVIGYKNLLKNPELEIDRLLAFSGHQTTEQQRMAAINFLSRGASTGIKKDT
jgi:hypothetical protein